MEIKGIAVKSTPEFVKNNFHKQYNEWLKALPQKSQTLFNNPVYSTKWYDLQDSVIIPTKKAGDFFFNGNSRKAAKEIGIYSAKIALTGVYKIFIRISSPNFVLSRARKIFASYYQPAEIILAEVKENSSIFHFKQFSVEDRLIVYRIAGWMEGAFKVLNCKDFTVKVSQQLLPEPVSIISVDWK